MYAGLQCYGNDDMYEWQRCYHNTAASKTITPFKALILLLPLSPRIHNRGEFTQKMTKSTSFGIKSTGEMLLKQQQKNNTVILIND